MTKVARTLVVVAAGLLVLRVLALPSGGRCVGYGAITGFVCARGMWLDSHRRYAGWASVMTWAYATLFIIFSLRPVAIVVYGKIEDPFHEMYVFESTYPRAVFTGLCGVVGFHIAETVARNSKLQPTARTVSAVQRSRLLRAEKSFALTLFVIAVTGYLIYLVTSGQGVDRLLFGRLAGDNSTGSSAYLYLSPYLAIPTSLLWLKIGLQTRSSGYKLLSLLLVSFMAHTYLSSGQRLNLLLVLVAFVGFRTIRQRGIGRSRRNTRTAPFRHLAVLSVVVFGVFVLVSARDVSAERSLSDGIRRSLGDVGGRIEEALTDADTEMVDALAVEHSIVPSEIDHQPGRVLRTTFASVVPSALWKDKPVPADGFLNAKLLGVGSRDASVAYSLAGSLFLDSSYLGVILGFALAGAILTRAERLLSLPQETCAYAAYVSIVVLSPILFRGNPEDTAGRALFILGPLVLLLWWQLKRLDRPTTIRRADAALWRAARAGGGFD